VILIGALIFPVPRKKWELEKFDTAQAEATAPTPFTGLRDSNHGSRTPEEEEKIFDPKDQDEAEVEEGQSFRQSIIAANWYPPQPPSPMACADHKS